MAGWYTLSLLFVIAVVAVNSCEYHCTCTKSGGMNGGHTGGNNGGNTGGHNGGNTGGNTGGGNGGNGGSNGGNTRNPKLLPSLLDNDTITSLVGPNGVISDIVKGIGNIS